VVRGTSVMFYVYFDNETKNILSITNEINDTLKYYISKPFDEVEKFISGEQNFNSYKIIEDVRTKGKYDLVPQQYQGEVEDKHCAGTIKETTEQQDDCIQIVRYNSSLVVNNFMNSSTCKELLAGDNYLKEYYIVDGNNMFILFDTFSIDLKKLAGKKQIKISTNVKNKNVSILTSNSHIEHVYKG
jgi:hypothetical protein